MRIHALLGCAVLAACTSDDGGTTAQGDCALDIVVSGGYSWKSASTSGAQLGCGSVGIKGTAIGVEVYGPGDDFRSVTLLFEPALAAGQVGDVNVTTELIAEDASTPRSQWKSALDACSFKIVKNEFTPDDFFTNKYIIAGTVTCSGELASVTTLPAATVNAFKFQSFENYTAP